MFSNDGISNLEDIFYTLVIKREMEIETIDTVAQLIGQISPKYINLEKELGKVSEYESGKVMLSKTGDVSLCFFSKKTSGDFPTESLMIIDHLSGSEYLLFSSTQYQKTGSIRIFDPKYIEANKIRYPHSSEQPSPMIDRYDSLGFDKLPAVLNHFIDYHKKRDVQ
ncbi:MAG: hypothetical protein ABIC95_02575 [archaeon]